MEFFKVISKDTLYGAEVIQNTEKLKLCITSFYKPETVKSFNRVYIERVDVRNFFKPSDSSRIAITKVFFPVSFLWIYRLSNNIFC